jgi:hypothetical protein
MKAKTAAKAKVVTFGDLRRKALEAEHLRESAQRILHDAQLESTTKLAYQTFAYRAGAEMGWEQLSEDARAAWREVVRFLTTCEECGGDLVCPDDEGRS